MTFKGLRLFNVVCVMAVVFWSGFNATPACAQDCPRWIGAVDTPGSAHGVAVSGDFAYVADRAEGLAVIDISAPDAPVLVGSFEVAGEAWEIAVSGGHAYLAVGSGLQVFDLNSPDSPVAVGFCAVLDASWSIAVSGDLVFVAAGDAGLVVIDVSDPSAPTEIGRFETSGYAVDVAISGDYAYVTDTEEGFRVIDVSTPSAPVEVGSYFSPHSVIQSIAVSGNIAYFSYSESAYSSRLMVVDISTPASPLEVGSLPLPGMCLDISVSGAVAYVPTVNSSEAGLLVIDARNPGAPAEIGYYDTPGESVKVAVSVGYIYVADLEAGLAVLQSCTPTAAFTYEATFLDVVFTDTSINEPTSWFWDFGDGSSGDLQDPTHSYGEAGTYTVTLTVSTDLGSDTVAQEITVSEDPSRCTPIYIAAAAAGAGAGDSMWATDLGINNFGVEELRYKFKMLPRDADNTDVGFSEEFTLAPDTNANFPDVWTHFTGAGGAGAIAVCVSDADTAGVTSRTYNTSDAGTFGQAIVGKKGMDLAKLIGTGERVRLGFLTENGSFRTNVGFLNAGAETITIHAEFFTADGTSLGVADIDIFPFSNNQWNRPFVNKIHAGTVDLGYIDVWSDTVDATFLTYASVIDNGTADPTTIWPFYPAQMVGGDAPGCTPYWIAAAASANGAGGTVWSTDLGINNLGAEELTYRFQFLPRAADNTDVVLSDPFTLIGGGSIVYRDVWRLSGGQGSGAVNVCVENGGEAGVTSRTFNTGDEGTFGQMIEGMRGSMPAKVATGEKVRLGYLFENEDFRTNIGFMNTGANPIILMVEFFDMEGYGGCLAGHQGCSFGTLFKQAVEQRVHSGSDLCRRDHCGVRRRLDRYGRRRFPDIRFDRRQWDGRSHDDLAVLMGFNPPNRMGQAQHSGRVPGSAWTGESESRKVGDRDPFRLSRNLRLRISRRSRSLVRTSGWDFEAPKGCELVFHEFGFGEDLFGGRP